MYNQSWISVIFKYSINRDNYYILLEKVRKQRIEMKNQEERSRELILENLKKKQLSLEKKRNYQKELIKVCREMLK